MNNDPINRKSLAAALKFLGELPIELVSIDFNVIENGIIEVDWFGDPHSVFTVEFKDDGTCMYSGFDVDNGYGIADLSDGIPKIILDHILAIAGKIARYKWLD